MARFDLKIALKMPTEANLILGGNILEGTIAIGDQARFRQGAEDLQLEIVQIGTIDYKIGQPDFHSHVALVFLDEEEVLDPKQIQKQEVEIVKGVLEAE